MKQLTTYEELKGKTIANVTRADSHEMDSTIDMDKVCIIFSDDSFCIFKSKPGWDDISYLEIEENDFFHCCPYDEPEKMRCLFRLKLISEQTYNEWMAEYEIELKNQREQTELVRIQYLENELKKLKSKYN